jgi:hypothetical protein
MFWLAVSGPTNHGERVFLDVASSIVVGLIVLAVIVAWIRRRRRGAKGNWWDGPNLPPGDDPIVTRRNPDQSAGG